MSRARYRNQDGLSLLKNHRHLESPSVILKDVVGQPIRRAGPHLAVEDWVPRILPTAYRAVPVQDKASWTGTLGIRMPGRGKVRLIVSCAKAELTGTSAVLGTYRVEWSAQRLLPLSGPRGPIEPCEQDGQTPLGLDEDRRRNAEAIGQHWCLGVVASSFLPLDCLPSSLPPGSLPLKTIGDACRQPAQALIEAVSLEAHKGLQLGQRAAALFTSLFTKPLMGLAR